MKRKALEDWKKLNETDFLLGYKLVSVLSTALTTDDGQVQHLNKGYQTDFESGLCGGWVKAWVRCHFPKCFWDVLV